MDSITHEHLDLSSEECVVLAQLLEEARTKLLVEIRRTNHRTFRDELRQRLTLVEGLLERVALTRERLTVTSAAGQ